MRNSRSRGPSLWIPVSALLLAVALAGGLAEAKPKAPPPAPDPIDSGTIYLELDEVLYGMDTDTGNRVELESGVSGRPSELLHWCVEDEKDERWFLQLRPVGTSTYGNGVYRHELFAVCESGEAYQLTDAPNVEPDHTVVEEGYQPSLWHCRPQWADSDTLVSYVAKRWSGDSIVEWGFYVLSVDPDNLDDHTAGVPTYIDVELELKPVDVVTYDKRVNAVNAWAPDGESFVYSQHGVYKVMRADYDGAADTWDTTELGDGTVACWAPVTDRILYKDGGAFVTMDPYDATDVTTLPIATVFGKKITTYVSDPLWSPSGTHIVYQVRTDVNRTSVSYSDVYVALADGTDRTNLTGDTTDSAVLVGWGSTP